MIANKSSKPKINPWGQESPEKLKQTSQRIGWSQQLKGLFNPDTLLKQTSESSSPAEPYREVSKEPRKKTSEVVLFSHTVEREQQKIYQETTVILQKLKEQVSQLEKSNKGLVTQLSKVKVEQIPQKSGIYYIRFLEWLLIVVRQMRTKVEEGQAWLSTFNQRKRKIGYWKMYKKHGTTFGLSYERTMATQTG